MKTQRLFLAVLLTMCVGSFPAINAVETQPNISRYGDDVALIPALEKANLSLKSNILSVWSVLHNYKGSGVNDVYSQTRAMFCLTGDISKRFSGELTFGAFGIWDEHDFTNGVMNLPKNGDVKILTANIKANNFLSSGFDMTAGRQFMGNPEDAVFYFGPSRDGRFLETTALDAVRAERSVGPMKMVLAGGEKAYLGVGGAMEPVRRQNVFAFELYSNNLFPTQNIKLYYYERLQTLNSADDDLACYGFEATGKIPVKGFSYLATLALNGGDVQATTLVGGTKNDDTGNYNGSLWRVIGYYDAHPSYGDINLNGGYVYVSGDGTANDGNVTGFRRIGRDCFYSMAYLTYEIISDGEAEGVENVIIPFAGVKYTPSLLGKKFQIIGNYAILNTDKPIAGLDGKGSEADLRFSYEMDTSNSFRVIGAKLWPAGIIASKFGPNPIDQIVFEYELKF